jgi:hypothetical protein
MSIVRENINFERGVEPMKAMGLGSKMLQMIKDLHMEMTKTSWELFGRLEQKASMALKGTLMKIYYDKEDPSKAFSEYARTMNLSMEEMDLIQTVIEENFDISVIYLRPNGKTI